MRPAPEEEIPQRFQRAEEVFQKKALAGAASGMGRDLQAGFDRGASGDPGGRSRRTLRRGVGRLPHPMPRPPRGDDGPAHALHGRGHAPDRGLSCPRRGLDRAPAGRAARSHAWFGIRVCGRVRRARAADHRDRAGLLPLWSSSSRRTTRPRCSTALRSLPGEAGSAVSGYLDFVGYRPLDGFDISEPSAPSSCPMRCCGPSGWPYRERRDGLGHRGPDRRRPPAGPRAAPERVRRAARGGPADLPAPRRARHLQRHLGIGSDATCGPVPAAAAWPTGVGSTTPSISSTPALEEMCSLLSDVGRPVRRRARRRGLDYRATHSAKDAPARHRRTPHPSARPFWAAARRWPG